MAPEHVIERDGPHPYDQHVGARVRARRIELGLSQQELGDKLGVSFQQVQKYERGTNRIGAGRMYDVAKHLQVPITYFYEGIKDGSAPADEDRHRLDIEITRRLKQLGDKPKRHVLALVKVLHDLEREAVG